MVRTKVGSGLGLGLGLGLGQRIRLGYVDENVDQRSVSGSSGKYIGYSHGHGPVAEKRTGGRDSAHRLCIVHPNVHRRITHESDHDQRSVWGDGVIQVSDEYIHGLQRPMS